VAEGRLLAPIQPIYPAIAKAARIQGTVVIEAIISKRGLVKEAHIVSGQPMLARAALEAVSRALSALLAQWPAGRGGHNHQHQFCFGKLNRPLPRHKSSDGCIPLVVPSGREALWPRPRR